MLNFKITGSVFAIKFFKIAQNREHVSELVSQANTSHANSTKLEQVKPSKSSFACHSKAKQAKKANQAT